jgi:putative phosphoribosyl transferase
MARRKSSACLSERATVTVLASTFRVQRQLPCGLWLRLPGHREPAMGAIATGGVRVLNEEVVGGLGIPMDVIDVVTAEEKQELKRRELAYRGS